ncbi:MAG TPA: 2-phosphosulfolactate phosphatase [Armatimonadota bacterium]|jgi:2-phosphosulfolactate phosphatase
MTVSSQIFLSRGNSGCALAVQQTAIAVVVDALRASTTIAALCDRGVTRVLVVARVEDARALALAMPDALLVGERGGERLPGFHLGNSPLEVLATPDLAGKTVIFTSSNGAQRLTACTGARHVLVGSVSNATALANWVRARADASPVVMVAAGQFPDEAFISPEDEVSCVYLAARLGLPVAEASQALFAQWEREMILRGLTEVFRHSRHAQRLQEIGYADDVRFCAQPDTLAAVPAVLGPVTLGDVRVGVELRDVLRETAG